MTSFRLCRTGLVSFFLALFAVSATSGTPTATSSDQPFLISEYAKPSPTSINADIVTPLSIDTQVVKSITTSLDLKLTVSNPGQVDMTWYVTAFVPSEFRKETFLLPPPLVDETDPDGGLFLSPSDKFRPQTEALSFEFLDLTGVRILIDQYHTSESFDHWSTMISDLKARGATIEKLVTPFNYVSTADFDILWVGEQEISWTPNEWKALREWVRRGNSILLEGDDDYSVEAFNAILTALGSGIVISKFHGTPGYTREISAHETTAGVNTIMLSQNDAQIQEYEPPATILIKDISGKLNTACAKLQAGRLVTMSDEIFYNSHIRFAQNRIFANQVFDWLSLSINWLQLTPTEGELEPHSSADVNIHIDVTTLDPGDYVAFIRFSSTYPGALTIDVPIHLSVQADLDRYASIDIRPESCPNFLNVDNGNGKSNGVIPVTLMGRADFDVNEVDLSTIRLEDIPPIKFSIYDKYTPIEGDGDTCYCDRSSPEPDGFDDLQLKFRRSDLAGIIEAPLNISQRVVTLTGQFLDGTAFRGHDCIMLSHHQSGPVLDADSIVTSPPFGLENAYPNPFNPTTVISFVLTETSRVDLSIYNITGQHVETLANGTFGPGSYAYEWNGIRYASGIYFYRFSSNGISITKKMIMIK